MKKMKLLKLFMVLSMIFSFYGVAFAGGGGPDPAACQAYFVYDGSGDLIDPPTPDRGKFLRGEFTAAQTTPFGFEVHVVLRWDEQEQMYSFLTGFGTGICGLDVEELKSLFASIPCNLINTEEDFIGLLNEKKYPEESGIIGLPVIADLAIINEYFCPGDGKIRGDIVVRVVPLPFPRETE